MESEKNKIKKQIKKDYKLLKDLVKNKKISLEDYMCCLVNHVSSINKQIDKLKKIRIKL